MRVRDLSNRLTSVASDFVILQSANRKIYLGLLSTTLLSLKLYYDAG